MVICIECEHCLKNGRGNAWYNFLCTKTKFEHKISHITGEKMFFSINTNGVEVEEIYEYPYCRDINTDGACALFSVKFDG